jgi:transposase
VVEVIRRDPRTCGVEAARWTLRTLQQVCSWLRVRSPAGLSALLARLGIGWKRARNYIRSPDPVYAAKRAEVARVRALAAGSAGRIICVYVDEVTIYRQPTLAQSWEATGRMQPLARYSHRRNTLTRVVGSLDAMSGRVVYLRASKIGVHQLVEFYQRVRAAYPEAERIYVVLDNWPVHVHPDLLVALEAQESGWQPPGAPNWRTTARPAAHKRWGELRLPIQLIWLPTYASWLNPIEKLWRKLQQEEIHLHRLADELERLRERIDGFLDQFANGSAALLRYVGLAVPN